MKKTMLTVLIFFAFVISNAQEKANHNTTRSNQSQGIIVKDDNRDDDCDGNIDDTLFIKTTTKTVPHLNFTCCKTIKKRWEDATANAVKEASKSVHARKHLFTKNGITYYYNGDLNKLNKCKKQLSKHKWIAIENGNTQQTKRKKRNKNFNRKGERIKRTQF